MQSKLNPNLPKLSLKSQNLKGQKMFQILSRAKSLEKRGIKVLHFELGDPEFETPKSVVNKTILSLKSGRTHYESSYGDQELRQKAIDVTLKSRGFAPSLEQLLVTPGANFQLYLSLSCIADQGDEIIIPDPGFVSYLSICNYLDLKAVPVHLKESNNFEYSAKDISSLISSKTKAIIINSPSNPTGGVTGKEELKKIYQLANKFNLWIISDEIYARIIYPGGPEFYSLGSIDKCKERTIIVNGFSKAYAMTGWRIGVVTAPTFLTKKMNLLLESSLSCVPGFIQEGASEALALKDEIWRPYLNAYKERRDHLVRGLNTIKGFSCTIPNGAFYAFPNIKDTGFDDIEVANKLLNECGIAITPGSFFGSKGKTNIRFSYVCGLPEIDEAIKRMQAYFGIKTNKTIIH